MPQTAAPLWDSLAETVRSGWCPGLVAGVRINGTTEVFATESLGFSRPEPMSEDTPFRISSLAVLGSILSARTIHATAQELQHAGIRFAVGSGTALVFLIISGIAVLGVVSTLLIKEQALRETVDVET